MDAAVQDAAQGMKRKLALAALLLAMGACRATAPPEPSGPRWIKGADNVGYGVPNSEFDLILGCEPDGIMFSILGGTPFQGGRPATITVDGIVFTGTETADPLDAVVVSHIKLPFDNAAMRRLAGTPRQIAFAFADGPGDTIPAGKLPAQFVRDCAARHGG
jgi:hypothetical protein